MIVRNVSPAPLKHPMFWILALTLLPIIIGLVLYFSAWSPTGPGNHGELIRPAQKIPNVSLRTLDGKPFDFGSLKNLWVMLYLDVPGCNPVCQKNLFNMRQVHVATDKHVARVRRVFVLSQPASAEQVSGIQKKYPDLLLVSGDNSQIQALANQLPRQVGSAVGQDIYLMDPQGYLILRYAPTVNPSGLLKDLNRLLTYSWVG